MLLLDIKTPGACRHEYTEQPMKSRGERVLNSLRKPKLRLVRIPAGVLLILGGLVGFLPLVGFWMVPLGLAVLAIDFPIADRLLRRLTNFVVQTAPFLPLSQRTSMFAKVRSGATMIESTNSMTPMLNERAARRALMIIALAALSVGLVGAFTGHNWVARWIWAAGTIPVVAGLAISIARDVLAGRMGVDAVAFVSMAAALALGQTLAGVVVAIMYARQRKQPRLHSFGWRIALRCFFCQRRFL